MTTKRALWPLALLLLLPAAADAGRSLDEPKAIRQLAKRASRSEIDAAMKASSLKERCAGAALGSPELSGMICRLAIHAHRSGTQRLKRASDVDARVRSAEDAWAAAQALAAYEPLTRSPGLPAQLFEGHRLACRTVLETYDALTAVPKSADAALRARVDERLAAFPRGNAAGLHEAACRCTQKSLELGGAAGASLQELGALQGALTGRSCFLDQGKVKTERSGPQTQFSGTAQTIAAANTDEAKLLAYAKTRDIGLARCREKDLPLGTVKDKARLERCACGEISRWSFPKERGRPELELTVPVDGERLGARVKVKANGTVASCGPLAGPLAQ